MLARIRYLWDLMAGQRLRYVAAIGALVVASCFLYLAPLVVQVTIDEAIVRDAGGSAVSAWVIAALGGAPYVADHLWWPGLVVVGLTVVAGVFTYLRGRWSAGASEAIARGVRDRTYDHLQHLPCSYFDTASTGDVIQRCTSDVETLRVFLATQVVEIGRAVIMLLVPIPLMLAIDVRMAVLSLVLIPIVLGFSLVYFSKVKTLFKEVDEAEGRMTTTIQENLTGIRVVRAFARQEHECDKFGARNRTHRDLDHRLYWLMAWFWSASDLLCFLQKAIVVAAGVYWLARGELAVGAFYFFLTAVTMFIWPVRMMGRILTDLGKAVVAMNRLQAILDEPVETAPEEGVAATPPALNGRIEFAEVQFAHDEASPVLDDVSFTAEPGQTIALLGPSGCGKSTIVNLLLRLYDYDRGSIRLGGYELRQLDRKFVRGRIAVVLQEPFLYSKTLRENITLGHPSAGESEMLEAAMIACVHESIVDFDDGYDTRVGERGVTLSGGQRQRVTLARALLQRPDFLILDDALSAIDTETEAAILGALRTRHGRQTTIVIAHRLSTLMHADRIIVMDHGHIVQTGTHDELLAEGGLYRRLWDIQSAVEHDDTVAPPAHSEDPTMSEQHFEDDNYQGQLDLALWKRILRHARPYRAHLAGMGISGFVLAVIDALFPVVTGRLIDEAVANGLTPWLLWYGAGYGVLIFGLVGCVWTFIVLAGRIATGVAHDLRREGFGRLQELSFSYYDVRPVGWLVTRLTSDCGKVSSLLPWFMLDLVWGASLILAIVVAMFWLDWRLALVVLAIVPPLSVTSLFFQRRLLESSRLIRKTNSQMTASFNECIMGVRTTKTLVREEANLDEFQVLSTDMYSHSVRNALQSAVYLPAVIALGSVGVGLALWRGGVGVGTDDALSVGTLVAFMQYAGLFHMPIQELARRFTELQSAQAAAERVQSLLDTVPEIRDAPDGPGAAGHTEDADERIETLEFRDVGFWYKPGEPVLRTFNLTVTAGQTIALVGATGGGKSTIVNLAARFYEPTEGEILVNGVDYRRRRLHWLQSNLGVVLQTPHLFSGTIAENIRYGHLEATDAEVEAAARRVNAHEFIDELEEGYTFEVGEGGGRLSMGQRQLIALARAVIADPQIFIMDEATSSVDTETERLIQDGIEAVLEGRIAFVIAHRLSTIRSADLILVIDGGEIVERGTHDELMQVRRGGHYRALYTRQFARTAIGGA